MMEPAAAGDPTPRAFLRVGGANLARHQLTLALLAKCERIICVAREFSSELVELQHEAERGGARFHVVSGPRGLSGLITATDEVLAIRRFLQESSDSPVVATVEQGSDLLVVIDHHEARIYRSESPGSIPEKLVPYDPHGYGKHLRAKVPETSGRREPESKSFYEAVATTLRGAERILIFGTGTGESNAMDHLVTYLRHDHADLANHVVGTVVIDENHTTEGQILAKAREFLGQK